MSQPVPKPSWKEEVNRKLEAHKSRRGLAVVDPQPARPAQHAVSDRAAQAAARVAARYARTPSFSEQQAAEARAALRAAEEATRKALEAQAVAHAALAELTAVEFDEEFDAPETDPAIEVAESAYAPLAPLEHVYSEPAEPEPVHAEAYEAPAADEPPAHVEVRWASDMPTRAELPEPMHAEQPQPESVWEREPIVVDAIETVDAAQPIPANLIQFPRELVATRRMRPRIPGEEEAHGQLSIFEVDPGAISTEPAPPAVEPEPAWPNGAEWSGLHLDSHPEQEAAAEPAQEAQRSIALDLAPLSLRLMATVVDCALIVAFAAGLAFAAAHEMSTPLPLRTAELMGVGLLALTGLLYHLVCIATLEATPGMKYAGIALCNFEDEQPSAAQLRERFIAMVVSLLPFGLGLAWSAFDENHLCWHDRLSRTYLRKC